MKKFLCLSLFVLGFFVSIDAQTVFYQINNTTGDEWSFGMVDNNGNSVEYQQISGNTSVGGNYAGFELPLKWRAFDQGTPCYHNGIITSVGGPVTPPSFCISGVTYNLQQFGPVYFLQFDLQ